MSEIYESDNDQENEDDLPPDYEETVTTRRGGKEDTDKGVTNASEIPLFHDADKRGLNTAAYLKVTKLDKPGKGYKGQMPLTSTLETISSIHGNGIYNIHLCNANHKVLRKMDTVEISLSDEAIQASGNTNGSSASKADQHLAFLLQEKARTDKAVLDAERERNKEYTTQVTSQAKQYTDMVTSTTEAAANRDREHMKGVNEGQQAFFTNMMTQQGSMFQQTIALMTMGHNHLMESMRATHERDMTQNSPAALMDILMKGINIGKEFENDDEPWVKALDKGGDMISGLLELKKEAGQSTQPVQRLERANPSKQDKEPKEPKEPLLTRDEIIGAVRLKKVLRDRGIDFAEQINQASKHYRDIPEEELYSDRENSDNTPKGKSNDSPEEEITKT